MFFRRKPDARLRLFEAMRLRNARLPEPLPPAAVPDLEAAKRRCLACGAKALCDEFLAGRAASPGFALFCPNNHYIEHVKRGLRSLSLQ